MGTVRNRNGRFSSWPSTRGRSGAVLKFANSNISGLPASGPLRRLPGRLGAWLGRGGHRRAGQGIDSAWLDAPAKVSIRPGAEQLWRTQEGAHGDGQTEAWPQGQRWMVHHAGAGVLDRLGLLLYRRELLGKALDGVTEQPCLGDGGVEKACLANVLHLYQVEPEMALLDHHGGHRLPEGPRRDFRRSWSEVRRRAQLLHQPRVGTTLVHLFERLGLVNLQDSHGVQGGGCLACSAISFGRKSGCQLTGLGRETRTVPPSGGVFREERHRGRARL